MHLPRLGASSRRWRRARNLTVVRYDAKAGQRSLDMLRWGLVPYWAKDINVGFANINMEELSLRSPAVERTPGPSLAPQVQ
jgi:putative SOS response-associated peptidase YedK